MCTTACALRIVYTISQKSLIVDTFLFGNFASYCILLFNILFGVFYQSRVFTRVNLIACILPVFFVLFVFCTVSRVFPCVNSRLRPDLHMGVKLWVHLNFFQHIQISSSAYLPEYKLNLCNKQRIGSNAHDFTPIADQTLILKFELLLVSVF